MATTSEQKPINTNYEIFILALSILSIFNLLLEILPIDPYVKTLVEIVDVALTPIFLADFCASGCGTCGKRIVRAVRKVHC